MSGTSDIVAGMHPALVILEALGLPTHQCCELRLDFDEHDTVQATARYHVREGSAQQVNEVVRRYHWMVLAPAARAPAVRAHVPDE